MSTNTSLEEFKKNVIRSFSTRAAAYEAHAQVQSLAALLLSEFVAGDIATNAPADGPILEIGCGTGFLSAHLLTLFPDRPIVVSDISEDMLALCKARLSLCPGFDPERVGFRVLDGEELKGNAEQFSAICSSFALQWFGRPDIGIANMSSALVDGGRIYFAVPGSDTFSQWKALCLQSDVPFTGNPLPSAEQLASWSGEASLGFCLKEHVVDHHYPDVHTMLKALKLSGTATRMSETGLSVGELRRLLRAGSPSSRGSSVTSNLEEGVVPISYQILYGCMNR